MISHCKPVAKDSEVSGKIVAAVSMTHTPGLGDRLDAPPADQMARLHRAFGQVRQELDAAAPDIVVAFVNDHFDMYWLNNMPTFSVSVSDVHYGPSPDAQDWLQMTRRPHPGDAGYGKRILEQCIADGFDMMRSGPAEFNHNVLIPKKFLWPDRDIPVVPVFINCFAPPLPTWRRSYELGRCIRKVIAERPERVALLASGGISHWPPFVDEDRIPADDELLQRQLRTQREGPVARAADPHLRRDFHAREARMSAGDQQLINVEWDREVMAALERGDIEHLLRQDYHAVERAGGNGGHEMAMWIALAGVLDGAPGRTVVYEPVKEWMGGVGILTYGGRQPY